MRHFTWQSFKLATLSDDLSCILEYLSGADSHLLKAHFEYYSERSYELKRNYHHIIILKNPELERKTKDILRNLNIPEAQWQQYLSLSMYKLLQKLNREGHPQIDYILELIKRKTWKRFLPWLLAAIGGIIVLAALLFSPPLAPLLQWLEEILTSVIGLPVLGFSFTVLSTVFLLVQNQTDSKRKLFKRNQDSIFLLLGAGINCAAYVLWIMIAAPMPPLVAVLSVMASGMDVIKELFNIGQEYFRFHNRLKIHESTKMLEHQAYARHVYGFNKHRNALLINLASSLLLLGIMAAWCFLPPGLILTIAAVSAICLVYTLKRFFLKANESRARAILQEELRFIKQEYEKDHRIEPQVSPALSQLSNSNPSSQKAAQPENNPSIKGKSPKPCTEVGIRQTLIQMEPMPTQESQLLHI
ncbi:APC family permease [Legionella jordanis]|uniref:Uncharacterized protein n=1 Tax=Legionella jordanis TaxID=456 RepID=A0A0W0VDU7_9GAMM|nr:hypothetical protein Ljor_2613 [Legionella jordanis]RMX05225.1 APC family permease [Legionella jordanis]VEH13348.1 Uncharacterised protein [Legionella jordanis]